MRKNVFNAPRSNYLTLEYSTLHDAAFPRPGDARQAMYESLGRGSFFISCYLTTLVWSLNIYTLGVGSINTVLYT